MKVLLLDHYDSFTYNLYQMLGGLGAEVCVVRYDELKLPCPEHDALILSPGPGSPWEYPKSFGLISLFMREGKPIMGICLGHQILGSYFGLSVVVSEDIVHGRATPIFHDDSGLFKGIPQGFMGARYHSLVVRPPSSRDLVRVSAWTEDGLVMGLRLRGSSVEGVQFHPESVLTDVGERLLENFLCTGREGYVVHC